MSASGGTCWTDVQQVVVGMHRRMFWAVLLLLGLGTVGCGRAPRFYGLSLLVSGDHNDWSQDENAPALHWDRGTGSYRGIVALPGDSIALQLMAPRTDVLIGAGPDDGDSGSDGAYQLVPATLLTQALSTDELRWLRPLHVATPLSARYALSFEPQSGRLRVDLAADAEIDQPGPAALLVTALRGADQLPAAEQAARATVLRDGLSAQAAEAPLSSHAGSQSRFPALTFLDFDQTPTRTVSLVGDWNGWRAGAFGLHSALAGHLRLRAMRAPASRVEYLLDRDGARRVDPLNLEVAWDGSPLSPNPQNLLGGNMGELRSVAWAPGWVESGPRLRRLPLSPGSLSSLGLGEALVGLPAGYAQHPQARYPSIYIHDGKDALVRGRYDRLLFALTEKGHAPPTIAVYLPAPDAASDRLSLYSHYRDARFPEVTPRGAEYGQYILNVVVPTVDKTYRTSLPRAMLGIDMAGPFTCELSWSDPQGRFTRLISQSGRFGWGEDPQTRERPYFRTLTRDRSAVVERAWFDWSDGDLFQVQATDGLRPLFAAPGYTGKVQFYRQLSHGIDFWESLRLRALSGLSFALSDIISPTGPARARDLESK